MHRLGLSPTSFASFSTFDRLSFRVTGSNFERWILVLIVAIASLGCQTLPGGGAASTGASSNRLRSILDSGRLRIGMTGDQAPLNMQNRAGEFVGLEVDMMGALAEAMGLEAEFVITPFSELLKSLEDGDIDVVASGMTITPERNARVAFAGPYFITGKSVLSLGDRILNVENPHDLDDPSRTYAALEGSTSAIFVREILSSAKLVTVANYDTAIKMVINGEIDALVGDYQVCVLAVWRNPDVDLHALLTPFTVEPLGIALPADAPLLVNLVENYLDALEYTGLLMQFKAKWLTDGSWVDELP
jgi:polar amino acid transport system substrate-binding protein